MKRVLFVDHANRILGGAEVNLLELLAAAAPAGNWTIACACPRASRLSSAIEKLKIPQFHHGFAPALNELRLVDRKFSIFDVMAGWEAMRDARQGLEKIISEFQPDVVVSCANKDHLCAAPICRRAGAVPVWWVNDVLSSDFFSWPVRMAFRIQAQRYKARLITVSDYARNAVLKLGLPAKQVVTVHNGLPLEKYRRGARGYLRQHLGITDTDPIIGIVGRMTPWKGQGLFCGLAKVWVEKKLKGHFVLVGQAFNEDQSFETDLREFVDNFSLESRVHFIPFQDDVVSTLSDLDVLIHASTRPEPFGRIIIEAMAAGVPVVASRIGGVPEIITEETDGLLAEPENLEDFMDQLKRLIDSPDFASRLAATASQTVETRFSLARVRQQFEQVILEVA